MRNAEKHSEDFKLPFSVCQYCPEINQLLPEFRGGCFQLSSISYSYRKGGRKGRDSAAWRRSNTSPRKKASPASGTGPNSSTCEGQGKSFFASPFRCFIILRSFPKAEHILCMTHYRLINRRNTFLSLLSPCRVCVQFRRSPDDKRQSSQVCCSAVSPAEGTVHLYTPHHIRVHCGVFGV